jgi:hypothetical protein
MGLMALSDVCVLHFFHTKKEHTVVKFVDEGFEAFDAVRSTVQLSEFRF